MTHQAAIHRIAAASLWSLQEALTLRRDQKQPIEEEITELKFGFTAPQS